MCKMFHFSKKKCWKSFYYQADVDDIGWQHSSTMGFFSNIATVCVFGFFFPFSIEISLLSQLKRISHVLDGNKSSTKC